MLFVYGSCSENVASGESPMPFHGSSCIIIVANIAGCVGTLVGNRTGTGGIRGLTAPAISVAGPTTRPLDYFSLLRCRSARAG